jgi:hypothetical protein
VHLATGIKTGNDAMQRWKYFRICIRKTYAYISTCPEKVFGHRIFACAGEVRRREKR